MLLFSSCLLLLLLLFALVLVECQYPANIEPKHECAVADNAPGKLAIGDAPIDLANTTAKAEFCIPVSIDIVRDVISLNLHTNLGTKYPIVNPIQCNVNTLPTINGNNPPPPVVEDCRNKDEFCATTPPHINDTNTTLANGVNFDTRDANLGYLELTIIPTITGNNITRAVAEHNVHPDTLIVPPTNNLTNIGVTTAANIVEHDVNNTDNATSALAINETKLLAVPPGEQPTSAKPKNNDGPRLFVADTLGNRNNLPINNADNGIIIN